MTRQTKNSNNPETFQSGDVTIKSEEMYRMLFESYPYFNFLLDLEGKILDLNDTATQLSGLKRENLIGKSFEALEDFFAEGENPEKYVQLFSLVVAGMDIKPVEIQIKDTYGNKHWLELYPTPIKKAEKILAIQIVAKDITTQKAAEKKLKFQANILNNIHESVIATDLQGKITYWNSGAENIFGFDEKEAKGQSIAIIFPDANHQSSKILDSILDAKGYLGDINCITRDGKSIWIDLSTTPVRDFKGDMVGYINVSKDITDKKRDQNALEASLNEKEMLLGEINNRMKNYTQMVSSLLEFQSIYMKDEENLENFKDNQNRLQVMLLINEVLSKSDDFAVINFSKFMKKLRLHLKTTYPSDVKLKTTVDSLMLDIDTAVPCALIINELLTNALKHAFPKGEGIINFKFHLNGDGQYSLAVNDNGSGTRADLQSKGNMSLMLVNTLVNQLGGNMDISTNGGTDFHITWSDEDF